MLAAMVLGAEGVQIGSRFVASEESSAHSNFKQKIVDASDGSTLLTLKTVMPVRLIRNNFFDQVQQLEANGASTEELKQLLGSGRAKRGMFEGNMDDGELEIGQAAALINSIKPAAEIIREIIAEFHSAKNELANF